MPQKSFCPLMRSFFWKNVGTVLVIPQFHHSLSFFCFWIWDFISFLVLLRLFLNELAGFFKVSRNPIPWLVSVLVETETGQSTGSCMPCHLSQKMPYHNSFSFTQVKVKGRYASLHIVNFTSEKNISSLKNAIVKLALL